MSRCATARKISKKSRFFGLWRKGPLVSKLYCTEGFYQRSVNFIFYIQLRFYINKIFSISILLQYYQMPLNNSQNGKQIYMKWILNTDFDRLRDLRELLNYLFFFSARIRSELHRMQLLIEMESVYSYHQYRGKLWFVSLKN